MRIVICPDKAAIGKACAAIIAAEVLQTPGCVLGLATGSSPLTTYEELVRLTSAGALDWQNVRTFNLDEYVGLPETHLESYHAFMRRNLFDPVGLSASQTCLPDGNAADLDAACAAYEQAIERAGGIDLQLLGIGHNGHIGFNEPDTTFAKDTHVAALTEATIEANKRFFDNADQVPRKAVSMGVASILRARKVVLIAFGADKADAVWGAARGPITPALPASALQLHAHVTLLIDQAAAARL